MPKKLVFVAMLLAGFAGGAMAQEAPAAAREAAAAHVAAAPREAGAAREASAAHEAGATPADPKSMAGMSILGNQETPKSLVIVPWKSSEIGNGIGVSRALDTRIRAVDKDVFMRELKYYGIRSGQVK
jgi:hypothetical protein